MDSVAEDGVSLLSTKSVSASPDTINKLVMRVRALTFRLLPVEVSEDSISEPTSRIITADVIKVYQEAAGDFGEALPYALLRARQTFVRDAQRNAADYDENMGRATACEVLARRIVHLLEPDRLMTVMSTRFRYLENDGDPSSPSSALESAIDQHCTIFLSSSEAQHVVNALWRGDWVQINNKDGDIDYVPYHEVQDSSYFGRLDPARLGVPRYQNIFKITVWLIFLGVYSQAVRQPLDRIDPSHQFDAFEGLLYSMSLAFSFEEMHKLYVTLRYFTWRAFGFWTVISLTTDSLLITAFTFRISGIIVSDPEKSDHFHYLSFQFLACSRLITVVENYKWIGTMTICVGRMLQESAIFFALLSVLLAGFLQGMYALDVADTSNDRGASVINVLLEGIMQAPDFSNLTGGAFGRVMYYMWMLASTIILLNILISLFSSAYEDVVDNAEAQYLAFFAGKTINMIRAPDTYVYPAPFNLIEGFLVAPFDNCKIECAPWSSPYGQINRVVMSCIFFAPLTVIALYEASMNKRGPKFVHEWMHTLEAVDEDDEEAHADPEVDDADGLQITKVPFQDLVKRLPNTAQSTETVLTNEIQTLKRMMEEILKRLDEKGS
ncbi:hypothetical protein EXIGLDRAFT_663857 [Exidia glandulosa HHB12029]|uniref:Calcium activated cation channel n=1 Tax=Exidia glandulosa HHB12029 TaxID=1314781 RepID=A0A165R1B2_EXIGL|nr:hypothetical protein EXIGLDRAFT_663857 [Exidia glandulosa HHB12029]